jgi:hypothetical protein
MNHAFKVSSDEKYHFISPSLTHAIIKAGRKKIVFVEGYDDNIIFNLLYEEHSGDIKFIDTEKLPDTEGFLKGQGACDRVKLLVGAFVTHLKTDKRFYGVIDRDLKTDDEREQEMGNSRYDGRLFIFFERYTLENYFIHPHVLANFLYGQSINHTQQPPTRSVG